MTTAQVTSLMGPPATKEQGGGVEEWHYCRTGQQFDEFVTAFFRQGRLVNATNYRVGAADGGREGDCSQFVKRGSYRQPSLK